jgi:alkanesulfonate monooxygenase SsuD/methylene tetrahydromethanopterin reductase-like flavin-dependent oxidoreductase (luciferase family)
VEGRFLAADDLAGLRLQAAEAAAGGAAAVFLSESALGDPFVLAAGLSEVVPDLHLGVRVSLATDGRHPTMLAREATSLDLVCGPRTVLCFEPPPTDPEVLAEALALCRSMWRNGEAMSQGPRYPVPAAVNRPVPATATSPLLALDLTGPDTGAAEALRGAVDLVLQPTDRVGACLLEQA